MLLTIDVGNTNIVLGVFEGQLLCESWRLATRRDRTADELQVLVRALFEKRGLDIKQISGAVLSSVVPPLTVTVSEMVRQFFGLEMLTVDATNAGLPVRYHLPEDVGADRLVNGVAAVAKYGNAERPIIVVDFGTATTFDVISAAGEYLGGVICPGVEISADALFQRAARLTRVDVRRPAKVIGTSTVGSIQSGLYFGYVSMVEGIVARLSDELGGIPSPVCVATGGLAEVIAGEIPAIDDVSPDLTLYGLRLVWVRNT